MVSVHCTAEVCVSDQFEALWVTGTPEVVCLRMANFTPC